MNARQILFPLFTAALLAAPLATLAEGTPKVVKKVPPEFPSDVTNVSAGSVKARLNIDAQGKVTEVTVLEATPKRTFDRAATTALMAWRFEPTGNPQTYDVKLVFSDAD